MEAVDADLAVVARRPSAVKSAGALEAVIDDIPLVGAGLVDDCVMPGAVDLPRGVFGYHEGVADIPRGLGGRVAHGVPDAVFGAAGVVL